MLPRVLNLLFGLVFATGALAADETRDYLSFATEDEQNSTEIFREASPAVVYVTTTTLRHDWSISPGTKVWSVL